MSIQLHVSSNQIQTLSNEQHAELVCEACYVNANDDDYIVVKRDEQYLAIVMCSVVDSANKALYHETIFVTPYITFEKAREHVDEQYAIDTHADEDI